MKQSFVFLLFSLLFSCSRNSSQQAEFYVRGNCEMCKERIETTAKALKGVSAAAWNQSTGNLVVSYDSTLVKIPQVHQAIAATGHGTHLVHMNVQADKALPACCQAANH